MNTSKQVNVMIGLLFVSFVVIVGYLFNESNRQEVETEEITHRNAERGARLFVANCRTCHDLDGSGGIGAAINNKAFWIFEEGNAYGLPATPEGEAEQIRIYLRETIECGRPGTYMATWSQRHGGPLSDTQINHLVTLLTNDPGGKTDFWHLVDVAGEHADEEQYGAVLEKELGRHPTTEEIRERSQADTVVLDPTALTVNDEACGNWTPTTKAQFRGRDPFSDAPAVVATAAPDEATPPPDVEGAVNVSVDMKEWEMAVDQPLPAGAVNFQVRNSGAVAHEFVVIRSDVAVDGLPIDGAVADEVGLDILARILEFRAGSAASTALELQPGQYLLFCNVPAHYTLGMAISVTVE